MDGFNALGSSPSVAPSLQHLRDIHLPAPVHGWPLAPGYFIMALLCLLTIACIVWGVKYYRKRGQVKREALQLLTTYEQRYAISRDSQESSTAVSELLKRVALSYYPRQRVASLQGEEWLLFLCDTSKHVDFQRVRDALLEWPYQPPHAHHDMTPVFELARTWIEQRRKPCSN